MAQSKTKKKILNFVYGMGGAVVLIGALFKLTHYSIGPLTGTVMLTIGLLVEAGIFALSAFDPVEEELDWSLVYPELSGANNKGTTVQRNKNKGAQGTEEEDMAESLLSKKLDKMLSDANLDTAMMSRLSDGIKSFENAASSITPTTDALNSTKKYSEELSLAASQMESLNSLYKVQLESAGQQAEVNAAVAQNASKLKEQMESLTSNLSSLNGVYGGMLSAMGTKN